MLHKTVAVALALAAAGVLPSAVQAQVGNSYRIPGTTAGGHANSRSGNFGYHTANGTTAGGGYRTGRDWSVRGSYGSPGGAGGSASIGRRSGSFDYRTANGRSYGGSYQTGRDWRVGGSYSDPATGRSYSGYVARTRGGVALGGEYRGPGPIPIPFTQAGIGGDARIAGRDSRVAGHYDIYDPTGMVRLGGVSGEVNRRGIRAQRTAGIGPVRASNSWGVRFAGRNTSVSYRREVRAPGAGYHYGATLSRRGLMADAGARLGSARVDARGVGRATISRRGASAHVSAHATARVGRHRVDVGATGSASISRRGVAVAAGARVGGARVGARAAVNRRGLHVSVTTPRIRAPHIEAPHLPHISLPRLW